MPHHVPWLLLLFLVLPAFSACNLEFDRDPQGRPRTISVKGKDGLGPLILRSATGTQVIDKRVHTRECYALTLFGRRGIAILHHGMQLRFYTPTAEKNWESRDIYSFYTPSWQGGLIQADINGDAYPDLFCGNYWIESPDSFEKPWRLYAINTFNETPLSAAAQLHWDGQRLLWVESHRPQGRAVWFTPPADRKLLWQPTPHEQNQKLDYPQLNVCDSRFSGAQISIGPKKLPCK
jgi:hypothetical protein